MASVAVLGMGDDQVDRTIARLLTVPTAAASCPCCCGAATWMAGWCGEGARGPAAPSGATTWSTRLGEGTRAAAAPLLPFLRLCPSVRGRGADGVTPSPVPYGAWPSGR